MLLELITVAMLLFTVYNVARIVQIKWPDVRARLYWRREERLLAAMSPHDRLRRHFAALGFPVDDMTDEEINHGVEMTAQAMRSFGYTAEEATEALRQFASR